MKAEMENAIREVFSGSQQGSIHFGQVIEMLLGAGVESYRVDYRACSTVYYSVHDESLIIDQHRSDAAIAEIFDEAAIQRAIRGSQQGLVKYPEFKRLSQAAGCIGYTVWLTGRHVSYYGRKGEVHIERFPD